MSQRLSPRRAAETKPVTLAEWAALATFFPRSFRPERAAENDQFIWVHGREETYRFRKLASREELRAAWKELCLEMQRAELLTPGLYVGPQALRWEQGVPLWLSDRPLAKYSPQQPPRKAEEIAVVTRRRYETTTLRSLVNIDPLKAREVLRQLARLLVRFHQQSSRYEAPPFEVLRKRYLPSAAGAHYGPDALAFLRSFFDAHEDDFRTRAANGFFGETHGRLSVDNVVWGRFFNAPWQVFAEARAGLQERERYGDALVDVAALAVDLEFEDQWTLARWFETEYFSLFPESFEARLYDFFFVSEALRRLRHADRAGADRLSALALLRALGIRERCIIVVDESAQAPALAAELGRVFGGIAVEAQRDGVPPAIAAEEALLTAERLLLNGAQPILRLDLAAASAERAVVFLGERLRVPHLLVLGAAGAPLPQEAGSAVVWIDPSLGLYESTLAVLRALSPLKPPAFYDAERRLETFVLRFPREKVVQ